MHPHQGLCCDWASCVPWPNHRGIDESASILPSGRILLLLHHLQHHTHHHHPRYSRKLYHQKREKSLEEFGLARFCMKIGALPRRCRPQVTQIGTHSAIHSRSAMHWRFNRSLTSSRYFRLPRTGLAKALDLENVKLFGYDFAML